MAAFTIENLTFTYPHREKPAIENLNLTIGAGEFLVVCGQSGSGKSTLLRNLKTVLAPFGKKTGQILFYGTPLDDVPQREQAGRIGYVLQNPDNQIVTDKVWHELAFGLESLGYDTETIRLRVAEMASFFGIQNWFMKSVEQLSGGQRQMLNLAAVMAMQPDVLILDEPTSQLDPIAAGDFLETVKKINRELGTTVILSEHRLEEVIPMADRVVVMDEGRILSADLPVEVGKKLADREHEMFLAMPVPLQTALCLYQESPSKSIAGYPLDVREGRTWLTRLFEGKELKVRSISEKPLPDRKGEEPLLKMKDVWFKYNREDDDVIKDLSFEVYKGELFCLVGGNGTGKTTALTLASGMNKPYRGKIFLKGKRLGDYRKGELFGGFLGVLPQNPQSIFVEKTVGLDLMEMLEGRSLSREEKEKRVRETADMVELESLLDMHPYDLSGGEQQRAALAKILLLEPQLILLDEPTKGLDSHFKMKLARILKRLSSQGVTILMVSHDVEFCGRYGDRCAMFFDGKIVSSGSPRSFFSGNSFYTTAANRMSRHMFEQVITADDLLGLCRKNLGGQEQDPGVPEAPEPPQNPEFLESPESSGPSAPLQNSECTQTAEHLEYPKSPQLAERSEAPEALEPGKAEATSRLAGKKRSIYMWVMLAAAPLTLLAGFFLLDDRKYYFISLLMAFYTMVPFFSGFERQKPQARELVLLSVLIAISVAGRAAFFAVPQVKPMAALAIISGIALGRESGFLVGSMSMFVSNFIFGQGPWTPWQMLGMGLLGFLAGLLTEKKILGERKLPVVVFGGLATTLVYGFIVDGWSILSGTAEPSWEVAVMVYGLGLPLNLIHGAGTAAFLYILEKPMIEKLERIKVKYGMRVFCSMENIRDGEGV